MTATVKFIRESCMLNLSRRLRVAAFAFAIASFAAPQAQQKPVIKVSSLTLPVFNPLVWNIMKARGFDAKHGFELDIHAYPSIAGFYAGFATGETDALIGGPTVFQKLYNEGVALRIIGTGFTLGDLVIFAKNPAIKSLADLKGKQLAIDMGGSQYQVVKIYTAAKGIDLGKDITVINANFGVARAQLEASRVDAALVIEPLASISAKPHPDWHVIFNGAQGWKELTGTDGWEIVPAMRADSIAKYPEAPKMLLGRAERRRRGDEERNRRGRQDRQRDPQAAARHPHRGDRQRTTAIHHQAGERSGDAEIDPRHDGPRRESGLLSESGRREHLLRPMMSSPGHDEALRIARPFRI